MTAHINDVAENTNRHINEVSENVTNHINAVQENLSSAIVQNIKDINAVEQDLADETEARIAGDEANAKAIAKETADRKTDIANVTAHINDVAENTNRHINEVSENVTNHINAVQKDLSGAIVENAQAIAAEEDARIEADDAIRQDMANEVGRIDNRIDKVDAKIDKVGAMAAAMASLRTMGYDPEAPTEIAVGIGQYRNETGIAIGAFHYPNKDFMLNFSLSTAGDEVMGGVGATWKIGRKKPAGETVEDKVAKAEAMKEAAKAARVKAQQARHAKMLAEK